jgi:short-subunit dehydrogenase
MPANYREQYGDWALVLGGSEGLGRAMAMDLASRGMNVALAARREGPLEDAARLIADTHGVRTRKIRLDLADENVVRAIEDGMAGDDVSFIAYNAAAEPYGEFLDIPLDEHMFNIAVNVIAPTKIVHHFGRGMVARGKGGIVLCSSLASAMGLRLWVGYGASKSYENILGEGLWDELRLHGVGACSFMIGTTYTDSFIRTQEKLGGIYAKVKSFDELPAEFPVPQMPEDASANLFAQIDKEWLPVIYANPRDEERQKLSRDVPKADLISMAGKMQEAWYS